MLKIERRWWRQVFDKTGHCLDIVVAAFTERPAAQFVPDDVRLGRVVPVGTQMLLERP